MKYNELTPIESAPQISESMPQQPMQNQQETQEPWYKTMINAMEPVTSLSGGLGGGMPQEASIKAGNEIVEATRPVSRPVMTGLADVADFPVRVAEFGTNVASLATGGIMPNYEKMRENQKIRFGIPLLPEGGGIKKALIKAEPKFAARNETERRIDNAASDIIGYFANPFVGTAKIGLKLATTMGILGEGASMAAEAKNLPGWVQGGAKLLTHLGVGLIANRWDLHGLDKELFTNVRNEAKGKTAEASNLYNAVEDVKKFVTNNASTPGAPDILGKVLDAEKIFTPGKTPKIDIPEAIDFIQNINRTFREHNLNDLAKNRLTYLKKEVIKTIEETKSPVSKLLTKANDFSSALHSRSITKQVYDSSPKFKAVVKNPTVQKILGAVGATGLAGTVAKDVLNKTNIIGQGSLIGAPIAGGLLLTDQLIKATRLIATNKIARDAWTNYLKASSVGEIAAMTKYAGILDKTVTKNEYAQAKKPGVFNYNELQPIN
jgi:hypothetical protein